MTRHPGSGTDARGRAGRAVPARERGDRLSTGIEFLDQQIGGGLLPGRVVCLRTAPGSQGELLLREVARTHGALYLTTTRTAAAVAAWLSAAGRAVDVEVAGFDGLPTRGSQPAQAGRHPDGAAQLEAVTAAVRSAERSLVIDPANPLERAGEPAYLRFLHRLQRHCRETASLAFVHVIDAEPPPPRRWVTLHLADEVWDVSVAVANRRVEFLLTVTKSRSDDVPDRQLKLDLGRDVTVDTSREIV